MRMRGCSLLESWAASSRRLISYSKSHGLLIKLRHASTSKPDIYDVVIVGGGPAGLGLAAALRASKTTSHLKIGLIDTQDLQRNASTFQSSSLDRFSNRCSSLTPGSVSFLKEIGTWEHIEHSRVQPYIRMHVWDALSTARLTFDRSTTTPSLIPSTSPSNTPIATMTENANLSTALLARLSQLPLITQFYPARVDSITLGTDTPSLDLRSWPLLTLSTGHTLAARLLVGADGPNSPVRHFASIQTRGWPYDRHAVVATLRLSSPAPNPPTAYQRFLPTGPIALLPLPGPFASLVWTTTPARAAHLRTLSEQDLTATLNAAFRLEPADTDFLHTMPAGQADELDWRMEHTSIPVDLVPPPIAVVQDGTLASFPLRMAHADAYTGERVALLGDAAHSVHPLAGQGLNLGLADAQALAGCVGRCCEVGGDVGDLLASEGYGAERYAMNAGVLAVCDGLHRVYGVRNAVGVGVRAAGMGLLEGWEGGKKALMGLF